ncbi:probable LRR receptor-like serine/threonine-protein kinase At3g47570 [Tripterygium wilfordii]|uniref:probable LRR receptor-like serine/threonine-protein kinase At3g47570 n=1 Tax=Tripterygium wilfordii TaxID=458696 RepID=UPI0018F851BF|nr:probable LRR receptor-like serine/threonine-protein kinase At3g47570 [Tripterygium wilfordii]
MLLKALVYFSHLQVLLILSFVASSFAVPSSNVTDEEALVAFSSAITYDPTNTILGSNWSTRGGNFCDWVAVTCSKRRQRVTALDFSNMGLEGKISPYVGNLSFLVSLVLSNNSFHGHIPSELGRLHRLKTLNLQMNLLEGSIPPSLHNCFKLERVSLAVNMLSGGIPEELGTLKNLQVLFLVRNNLNGTIPISFGNLSVLETFTLMENRFTGSFPLFMFNISSIEYLSLSNNSFSGYLPTDICLHWPRLDQLYLDGNQFIGQIASTLRHCTGLTKLDLSHNKFNGSVPIGLGTLQKLEFLSLARNDLTGTIPTSLGNISSLAELLLSENNIHGGIPDEFAKLTSLVVLHLQYNYLTGPTPQSLFNISSLRVISIVSNNISGELPPNTGLWLPNLEEMYFGLNRIGGSIPTYLSNSSKLFLLDLSENLFIGPVPSSLENLPHLRIFSIGSNRLTGDPRYEELRFLTALTNCRFLEKLSISNNRLGGVLPYSIGNFSDSLQMIIASENHIHGPIPESISSLRNLNTLVLGDNNLYGTIPPTIGNLQNLQRLFLRNNQIRSSIPEEICNLRNLGELSLQDNRLAGPIPQCIGSLNHLQELDLSNNSLSSSIPVSLWSLENIIIMHLSNNFLGGKLSSEMKMSRVMEEMDISQNQITGKIPSILGAFESLRYLDLSKNSLHETIPETLGGLQSLEFLDLSYNYISGPIPKSLETLDHLEYLNLSYNDLSGEVPYGGIFANFTTESFLANKELCGQLLTKPCPHQNSNTKQILLKYIIPIVAVVVVFICLLFILRAYKHKNKKSTPSSSDLVQIPEQKIIAYHELRRATNNFSDTNLLGIGSYGSVYMGTISDGTVVAVKVLNPNAQDAFKSFDAECKVLRTTRHRNLVKIITSCSNPAFRALIMEYMSNGSLEKWLYFENCNLNLFQRISIMLDVAIALDYLHYGQSEPIVHCDLKPSNILLDEDMVAHVGDFGIAKILTKAEDTMYTRTLGTIGYVAPEYGSEGCVSIKGDMYSYGIMMLEIVTGKKPTDEIFSGEVSLRQWVSASYPNALLDVVDSVLKPNGNNATDIDMVQGFLFSLLEMGLECSREIPDERMDVKDIVAKLTKIKQKILHRQRYRSMFLAS